MGQGTDDIHLIWAPHSEERGEDYDPGLTEQEKHEVEEQRRPAAPVLHEVIREEGHEELERPVTGLALSGLASGLSMGTSLMMMGLLQAALPDTPWRHLLTSFGYTMGFLIVVLGRQQLYTENTLTPVLPFLAAPQVKTLGRLLRLWAVVLATNLLGAYLFAWAASHTAVFTPEVKHAFTDIGVKAATGGVVTVGLKGIFAGWLIALMVWLLPSVVESRIWVILLLTYAVAVADLSHIVAGSVEVMYAACVGAVSWGTYWGGFMLPAFLGNTLGGVLLVAMLNHGQVVHGRK